LFRQPRPRSSTAKYQLDIFTEYDAATPTELGVLLRREGLYSSHLAGSARPATAVP